MKPCPFCGSEPVERLSKIDGNVYYGCWNNLECPKASWFTADEWNTRPIEDALRAEIARLQEKLHDEMSQLEIATDLGNKRWVALNDIYENGEKHNANWCKRKAQEGLGVK